jgi:hypothetical protein
VDILWFAGLTASLLAVAYPAGRQRRTWETVASAGAILLSLTFAIVFVGPGLLLYEFALRRRFAVAKIASSASILKP